MQYCSENILGQNVSDWLFAMIFIVFILSDPISNQHKGAMAKKVVVFCRNQMKLLVFISLVKTFIVDKALMPLFCHLIH